MEFPSWEQPNPLAFSIPYSPERLRFQSEFTDKTRFQKLGVDRKFLQAINFHLSEHIDKNVMFYLKGVGDGKLITYRPNRVSYYQSKELLNAGVAPFEYPVDNGTKFLAHCNESNYPTDDLKNEVGTDGTVIECLSEEGKVLSPGIWGDGEDDWVDVPNYADIEISDYITLECQVKRTATGATDGFFYKRTGETGFGVQILAANDKIEFIAGKTALTGLNSINTVNTDWHHIATTYDTGVGKKIYIDGVLDNSDTETGQLGSTTVNLQLLRLSGNYFGGYVDEIRICADARNSFGGISPEVIL